MTKTFDDELLMAYADGELDPGQRAAIEEAMRSDPEVAAAVARHQNLRRDVFGAFADVLAEPVPERLQPAAPARVIQFDEYSQRRAARGLEPAPRRWSWPQWGALAASLAVGVLAGVLGAGLLGGSGELAVARGANGELLAKGRLDRALDRQLAGTGAVDADIRVGLSFVANGGGYCRSFVLGASAGLACREGGQWRIPVLARAQSQGTAYRQAGAALPPAVLDAVDARIVGNTLDAAAERAARDRGWVAAGTADR
ncbi:anti-sigma factor family protein [Massilia consociata]|uniref:Anti-sigma factor family protein n=1 Tax=Massilia consociata TaxID=760117 RepID=A0ABV6FEX7_9BURK